MGASRGRIITQLLTESLLLAFAGGLAGIALATWIVRTLVSLMPVSTTMLAISTTPDWRILLFNLGITPLTGIIFGLLPAVQATRPELAPTLKDQVGSIAGGNSVLIRKALVARAGDALAVVAHRRGAVYPQPAKLVAILEGNEWDNWVTVEGYKNKPGEFVDPHMNFISPDYFKALDVPVLLGRDFRVADSDGTLKVGIVNEKFSRKYFPNGNAIGRHIGMGGDPGTKTDIEIVGVVRDCKYESMRDEMPEEVFLPYQQVKFVSGMSAYIRTARNPEQVFSIVRQLVTGLDANIPIYRMRTLSNQLENSLLMSAW